MKAISIRNNPKFIRLALFATGNVGQEIAAFLNVVENPPVCLVLDTKCGDESRNTIVDSLPTETQIIESTDVYKEETLDFLKKLDLELSILAWWPYIIRQPLISIPKIGTINFHPSLLPYNKGKHYNFWTIVEGTPFGVTLHWVDEGVDTGAIAFQRQVSKSWEDNGKTLYEKAQKEIVSLFKDSWPIILSKNIPRKSQPTDIGTYHHSKELNLASEIKLDAQYSARDLLNILRARTFFPHPGAWFVDDGKKYQVRINIEKIDEA